MPKNININTVKAGFFLKINYIIIFFIDFNSIFNNFFSKKKLNITYFSNVIYLLINLKKINSKQNIFAKTMLIIYFFIDFTINIKTKYKFCGHHYFKNKIISFLTNMIYFVINYSIILYNIIFFYIQLFYLSIWIIAIFIII